MNISSSSTVYKIENDDFTEDELNDSSEGESSYSEILVTIQNNLVDIHSLGCYILLALGILIGVGVVRCWKR